MKRYLRFSLRGLLICVTLAAVFGGLEISRQTRQAAAVSAIRKAPGCFIAFDYDVGSSPEWNDNLPAVRTTLSGWVRQWTNSDFFSPVVRLWLNLDGSAPSTFEHVSSLVHLRWLHIAPAGTIPASGVDCPPLDPLLDCPRLEYLVLGSWVNMRPNGTPPYSGTGKALLPFNVDPEQIRTLTELRSLRVLAVGGAAISDEHVDSLAQMQQLQYLYLSRTELSDDALAKIREKMPGTQIVRMSDRSTDYSAEINSRF